MKVRCIVVRNEVELQPFRSFRRQVGRVETQGVRDVGDRFSTAPFERTRSEGPVPVEMRFQLIPAKLRRSPDVVRCWSYVKRHGAVSTAVCLGNRTPPLLTVEPGRVTPQRTCVSDNSFHPSPNEKA